jgi:hypothetical protein
MAAVIITTNVMVMAAPVGDTFSTASIKQIESYPYENHFYGYGQRVGSVHIHSSVNTTSSVVLSLHCW